MAGAKKKPLKTTKRKSKDGLGGGISKDETRPDIKEKFRQAKLKLNKHHKFLETMTKEREELTQSYNNRANPQYKEANETLKKEVDESNATLIEYETELDEQKDIDMITGSKDEGTFVSGSGPSGLPAINVTSPGGSSELSIMIPMKRLCLHQKQQGKKHDKTMEERLWHEKTKIGQSRLLSGMGRIARKTPQSTNVLQLLGKILLLTK